MASDSVTFGFTEINSTATKVEKAGECLQTPRSIQSPDTEKLKQRVSTERNVGLGNGPGGQIARSFFSEKGGLIVESLQGGRNRGQRLSMFQNAPSAPSQKRDLTSGASSDTPTSIGDGAEPQGMFMAILLNDMEPPTEQELQPVREHRWTFHGAMAFAKRSRSYCFFVRCLLELQRNVQLEEEGDPLEPKLANACKTFVVSQCRLRNTGVMYQLLTHFISNSSVFHEWDQFLRLAFVDERASQEVFLVPHLEQVWGRFCRFSTVLEGIFDVLNARFVWRHRLPKVGDLVLEHMKRRCFSSDIVVRNELFSQAGCRNETIKQVKYTFGLT
uniref:Uncharacterized protein n=1 Tax=Alexandrium monilatum TaxID=311494 RepID=A0A7S4Q8Q3_9DINO